MRTLRALVRVVVVLAVVGALAVGGVMLVKRKKAELAQAPRYGVRPLPVRVVRARRGDLAVTEDYLAVVEPIRVANLSARLTAPVEEVPCDEGDRVKAGQVLAVLDGREIRDGIEAVSAQMDQARADLAGNQATVESLAKSLAYWRREAERDKTLAAKGDIPGAQAEATTDKADEFQGRLGAARQKSGALGHLIQSIQKKKAGLETQLGYCTLTSPYDGVVRRRQVDPGDLASPGKTVLVVEDRSRLRLAFDVPQQDLPRVREGLDVHFVVGTESRSAKLSHLYPSLNRARMLRAEADLAGAAMQGLSCGAYVPVSTVLQRATNATLVPASALVEGPKGQTHVFVVRDGKLAHPTVKVLASHGDLMAVEGVEPGEQVVVSTFLGWARLAAGQPVEALE